MPRNYVRKTDNASYPLEKLLEAVRAVKNGSLSGYEASKQYGIPRSTIINRVYGRKGLKSSTLGRAAALSREVEEDLVKNLRVMEKHGFGLTRQELLETVGQYVLVNLVKSPFKNGVPGEDWFLSFKKRHNLSIKKPQPVEYARKLACSPYIIYPYFDLLEKTVNELGLSDKPTHIWNVDETSFSKDPSKSKVVGCKGFTSTRTIASPGKDNTTILLGCNALGEKTPPMIVFKGKNVWDQWTSTEDYPGTAYAATSNGWMETPVFEAYFEKVFLKTVGEKRPILLLYDGHATHVGINLIKKAREANITILKIPPHTSHLLQPLDLAVNKSFKDRWDVAILKWQRMNIGKQLPKKEFSKMIGQIWKTLDPAVCAAGFRKGGIYPLNKLAIPENQFNQDLLREWKQKSSSNATELVQIPTKQPPVDVPLYVNLISANTKSQEPRAGTSTQADPVFQEKSPKSNTFEPDSLLKLSLKNIMRLDLTQINDSGSLHLPQSSQNSFELNSQSVSSSTKTISKQSPNVQITENRIVNFELNAQSVPSSKRTISEQSPNVPILENRIVTFELNAQSVPSSTKTISEQSPNVQIVTFEDLLLMRIKAGTSSKVKRKRVATGAEVITSDDVYKRTQEAEKEKQNKTKQQEKRSKNKNKVKEEDIEDNREHKKKGKKAQITLKKCKKRPNYSTSSSESETEVKYDEYSDDSNNFWEEVLNRSNEEDDEENKEKKEVKRQEKQTKNRNKVKEENIEDPRQPNKKEKKERKSTKTCRKITKNSITSSECVIGVNYNENSDGNDYEEKPLNGCNEEDDDENKEKKHKIKRQEKQTKNMYKGKGEKVEDHRQQNKKIKKETKPIKQCRKRPKNSMTSSESETEINYDEDNGRNDYCEKTLNESNEENVIDSDKENCNSDVLYFESDWLLVKFCTKKSIKHYVGVVLTINEVGAPVVKYARKKSKAEGETIFVFPMLDDISEVKHTEDIVTKLPNPAIGRRGQIIFKMTFNSFNIQ